MRWLESQIDTREKLDQELVERAYAELAASVVSPKNAPRFNTDDIERSDGAVRACLRYMNVEPGNIPDGVKDVNDRIEYLCRPSGVMFRTVRLEGKWYEKTFGCLIGKLKSGESVALLPSGLNGYCYIEPESGHKVKINKTTASELEGEAVFFYRALPPKSITIRDLMAFIFRVLDIRDYIFVVVAAAAVTLVGLLPAVVNQIAFGTVLKSAEAGLIAPIGMLLLGVAVSTAAIGIARNLVMARVSIKLDTTIEAATFSRTLSLPASFFKQYSSGDLASRIAGVSALAQSITGILLGSGLTSLLSIVYIFQIVVFAPVLAAPAFLVVVLQAALTVLVTIMTMRYEKRSLKASTQLSGTVTALLNGISKIKLAGAEDRAFAKWASGYSEFARATYNRPGILRALPAIVAFIGLLGNILIFFLAGVSSVSLADYMSFNVAFGQTTAAIFAFAGIANQIAKINPMLSLVEPLLEATPETSEDKPSVGKLTGSIEVTNVSFRYGEELPYVVKDLSFKISPGEYVAIVGKSGCGKSTIMRLLLGFEVPETGSIFYSGYDVTKVDLRSLRNSIGTVMQDGKLFMGDIYSNIVISSPQSTLDDAWDAAEMAGIADDIRKMPMGMQTLISEGAGGVSGGQRQRIMIARAICGNKKILMFDEATSALDNVTQKHVSDSLEKLKCTRVVVAHRLSTVRHCDRILVIDNGSIAESGSYDELIEKNGIFAELVARQRLDNGE